MLDQIMLDIQATEIEAFRRDINMTVQRLYSMYVESLSTSVPLSEFAENVLTYSSTRKEITKEGYRQVLKNVNEFSPNVSLEDIDLQWLKKYENWIYSCGCSESTVQTRMKVLRTMFNEAIKRDLLKPWQTPFRLYEIKETRYRTDVLRFTEMEELLNYKFTDQKLRRARDFFMLSCYTGLRWADLIRLTSDNIRQIGDETWLTIKTQKTGILVQIPLSIIFYGRAMQILDRYKSTEDLCGYKNNSSYNRLLHEIAGHARLSTTQKYIQLSTASIEADLRKAFPRDREIIIPEAVPLPDDVEEII